MKRVAFWACVSLAMVLAVLGNLPVQTSSADNFADPAFERLWARTDLAVASGRDQRPWVWGERPFFTTTEVYLEGPGGGRIVQYFDKGRMEVNDPTADRLSPDFVSSGMLVKEMVSGRVAVGADTYRGRRPPNLTVVGDPAEVNPEAPTYASFAQVASIGGGRGARPHLGEPVRQTIDRRGRVGTRTEGDGQATVVQYVEETGHNIPDVFWNYLNAEGPIFVDGNWEEGRLLDWQQIVGNPLTEAYWTRSRIDGVPADVLVQLFERRVLTYQPSGPRGPLVEMGNVGRHYDLWRYPSRTLTPTPPPATPTPPSVPASLSSSISPAYGPGGTTFKISIWGFAPNETVSYWLTSPSYEVTGGNDFTTPVGPDGRLDDANFETSSGMDVGLWAVTFQGQTSGQKAIVYFFIERRPGDAPPPPTPTVGPLPTSRDATVQPPSGPPGTKFSFEAWGFTPGEKVGVWLTDPTEAVYGARFELDASSAGRIGPFTGVRSQTLTPGNWALSFQGVKSGHLSVAYFRIE